MVRRLGLKESSYRRVLNKESRVLNKALISEIINYTDALSFNQSVEVILVQGLSSVLVLGAIFARKTLEQGTKLALEDHISALISEREEAVLRTYFEHEAIRLSQNLRMNLGEFTRAYYTEVRDRNLNEAEAGRLLRSFLKAAGYAPTTARNVQTIYHTAFTLSYNGVTYTSTRYNPEFWGYTYTNPVDENSRENHAAQNGVTLPKSDPFWSVWLPPNGYNCRCRIEVHREPQDLVQPSTDVQPDPGFGFNIFETWADIS